MCKCKVGNLVNQYTVRPVKGLAFSIFLHQGVTITATVAGCCNYCFDVVQGGLGCFGMANELGGG